MKDVHVLGICTWLYMPSTSFFQFACNLKNSETWYCDFLSLKTNYRLSYVLRWIYAWKCTWSIKSPKEKTNVNAN
jgi:hypothetical protein